MQTGILARRSSSAVRKRILEFAILTIIMGSVGIAIGSSRSLILDPFYRWAADSESSMYVVGTILAVDAVVIFCFMNRKTFHGTFSMLTTVVVLIVSTYAVFAMSTATDFDGSDNPYVRAEEANARQYRELAVVKQYPEVARQIARAAADGIVTKGEAYDILNGDALRKSIGEASAAEAARTRTTVLSTR